MTTGSSFRGFVLQPTYRVESGRPVVQLYGRLDQGSTFLVRDTRQRPYFYLAARDSERARRAGAGLLPAEDQRSLLGEPVVRVEVQVPTDVPRLRERLVRAG
ncbi:MAG TPA: DNA polymerase II, partial [Vicinamibacteria bacterium]|nr:DNA polymerase II [Vicinamibacteria bacterium]